MKRTTWAGFGIAAFVAMSASFGGLAAFNVAKATALYQHHNQVLREHVHLGTLAQGWLTEVGSYYTTDPQAVVAAWYMSRYGIEPVPGLVKSGECHLQAKVNDFGPARLAIVVSLCPARGGTQVAFGQTLYLGR